MNILSNLTTLNIFLIWAIFVVGILLGYTFISLKKSQQKSERIKDSEEKRWKELENKAQKDYQEILETANKKAQQIIFEAAQIKHETTTNFQSSVEEMLKNQKEALEASSSAMSKKHLEEIDELNKQSIQILTNVYKDIEISAKSDLQKYKDLITQQTFEAEKVASERIKEEYEKLEKEIQARKEQRIQELDENIYKVISKISKDVIGKSIDLSSQEDLIIKSLDEAKKEGII